MSDQTAKRMVEALVVHLTSGATARANVVPGSVKVRYDSVTRALREIDYESYPDEDELVYIDPSQVAAVVVERWEHPTTDAEDDAPGEDVAPRPRTWHVGDPEPGLDVLHVWDRDGHRWSRFEGGWWCYGTDAVAAPGCASTWNEMLQWGPLTDVPPTTKDGDDDE